MNKKTILEIKTENSAKGNVILHFKMGDGTASSVIMPGNKVYELVINWLQKFPEKSEIENELH